MPVEHICAKNCMRRNSGVNNMAHEYMSVNKINVANVHVPGWVMGGG